MSKLSRFQKLLDTITSPEKAVALKGKDRVEYLDALDNVYGDRSKRAKDMGFGEDVVYHGTTYNKPIDRFRESGIKVGDTAKYGRGVYTTEELGRANQYANFDEGVIYPLKIKEKGVFEISDLEDARDILKSQGIKLKKEGRLRSAEEGLHLLEKAAKAHNVNVSDLLDKAGKRVDMRSKNFDPSIQVSKPNEIRSTNAAFDPRFKDSDLIMAAKESSEGGISKVLNAIGAPQRKMLSSIANKLGTEGSDSDSEESSRAIVQNIADRMGLPEDSSLINAGKALGVAGLEVFADPLNAIPVTGIAKAGMKAVNKADPQMFARLKKMFSENPKRFEDAAKGNPELEQSIEKLKMQGPIEASPSVTKLRDDAGFGAVGTRDRFDKLSNMFKKGK